MAQVRGPSLAELDRAGRAFAARVRAQLREALIEGARALGVTPSADDIMVVLVDWDTRVDGLLADVADAYWAGVDRVHSRVARLVAARAGQLVAAGPAPSTDLPVEADVVPRVSSVVADLHLAAARNRLVGVGDVVWEHARAELLTGMRAGETTAQLRDRVVMSTGLAAPRAEAIARTEVNGAMNLGALDEMSTISPDSTKTWLATAGPRTRPAHAKVDGQTVKVRDKFDVSGVAMTGPHDPTAPGELSINCRCSLTYEISDEVVDGLADEAFHLPGRHDQDDHAVDTPSRAGAPDLSGRGRVDGVGTEADPIDVRGDISRAVRLLGEGRYVRLNQPDEAATLLRELHAIVAEARASGGKAKTYDLCKVSVSDTNLFCAEHKGHDRVTMPQLSGKPLPGTLAERVARERGVSGHGNVDLAPEFREALAARGVRVTRETRLTSHLRASQRELNGAVVAALPEAFDSGAVDRDAPIFVTRDNYVLDGHHRWAARVYEDAEDNKLGDVMINVDVIDMDIGAAITFANQFAADSGIAPARVASGQIFHLPGKHDQHTHAGTSKEAGVWADDMVETWGDKPSREVVRNALAQQHDMIPAAAQRLHSVRDRFMPRTQQYMVKSGHKAALGFYSPHPVHKTKGMIEFSPSMAQPDRAKLAVHHKTGWWSRKGDSVDELHSQIDHEYGHHLDAQLSSTQRDTVMRSVAEHLGLPAPADGDYDAWVARNKRAIGTKLSQYGAASAKELIAEVWREYSSGGEQARPNVVAIGTVMHDLLGGHQ